MLEPLVVRAAENRTVPHPVIVALAQDRTARVTRKTLHVVHEVLGPHHQVASADTALTPGAAFYREQPVIVLFAVDVAVPRVTRKFRVQWQFTFGTLQTPYVPTHIHSGQVETVVYRSTATGATSSVAAVLRIGCQSWTVNILQHIHVQNMTTVSLFVCQCGGGGGNTRRPCALIHLRRRTVRARAIRTVQTTMETAAAAATTTTATTDVDFAAYKYQIVIYVFVVGQRALGRAANAVLR